MSGSSGRLLVVGAGLMGSGIAQVAAVGGWDVALHDTSANALERARAGIEDSLRRFVGKDVLSADEAAAALDRILPTADLDVAADVDFVVEAVFEDLELKRATFAQLDRIAADDTVLATNTSAIPITAIAAATARPESVVGTHFFSPVPMMALCELVRGQRTSDDTLARAQSFAESAGKTCVTVNRDVAGFITTRLISALILEAIRLVETGVASPEDIDTACRLGFGHRMGPLATVDLTGLDVIKRAASAIVDETGNTAFFPPELLSRMVDAGLLGRKSGQGFFSYPPA
ncbi:MAG TPA: 3-hydroxyacyl-CoA dehydrogenase family protein [Actinopolymorphaceae bacterium]|jgi:3-hydroxybutyryl-CoA dehydrogenase